MKLSCMIAMAVALSSTSWAQSTTVSELGSLSGTVLDSAGAVVPGATISIRSEKLVGKKPAYKGDQKTNEDGKFSFAHLQPGYYKAIVTKLKFKKAKVMGIEVIAGKTSNFRVGLVTPKESRIVEVICDPPGPIQGTASEVNHNFGNDYSGTLMKGAPQPRDLGDILRTVPGVN